MLRLELRKNRHSRVPAFSPYKLAGKIFLSCAPRRKISLRSSGRDSPMRDTSFRMAEEVPVLSYAFDSESVTTVRHAANVHERSLGILQELFNNRFRFASVRDLGIDHVVICIVSAEHATLAKVGPIFVRRAVALAMVGVNENRTALGIRMIGRYRCVRKKNDPLTGLRPAQTMPAGKPVWRIRGDDAMFRRARSCCPARCFCNLGGKRNNLEVQSFHAIAKCIASIRASTKFGQRIPRAIYGRQSGKLRDHACHFRNRHRPLASSRCRTEGIDGQKDWRSVWRTENRDIVGG